MNISSIKDRTVRCATCGHSGHLHPEHPSKRCLGSNARTVDGRCDCYEMNRSTALDDPWGDSPYLKSDATEGVTR